MLWWLKMQESLGPPRARNPWVKHIEHPDLLVFKPTDFDGTISLYSWDNCNCIMELNYAKSKEVKESSN